MSNRLGDTLFVEEFGQALTAACQSLRLPPEVAVRIRDRSYADVVADLVEGVLVANGVIAASERGRELRDELVAVVEPPEAEAA